MVTPLFSVTMGGVILILNCQTNPGPLGVYRPRETSQALWTHSCPFLHNVRINPSPGPPCGGSYHVRERSDPERCLGAPKARVRLRSDRRAEACRIPEPDLVGLHLSLVRVTYLTYGMQAYRREDERVRASAF